MKIPKLLSFFKSKKEVQEPLTLPEHSAELEVLDVEEEKREIAVKAWKIAERHCREAADIAAQKVLEAANPKSKSRQRTAPKKVATVQEREPAAGFNTEAPTALTVVPSNPVVGVAQLPQVPDEKIAVPNSVLRSALFGIVQRGRRRLMEQEEIVASTDITIKYTGARLDQNDLDVWEALLHIAKLQKMGTECRFTAYEILKKLGWADKGQSYIRLDKIFDRLSATTVRIETAKYAYFGSLVEKGVKEKDTKKHVVILNKEMKVLFEPTRYTVIDFETRQMLGENQLAKWLHGFYATHAEPMRYSVAKLHVLCGSEIKEIKEFRRKLKKALSELAAAYQNKNLQFDYEIDADDCVCIKKSGTGSQERHKIKKYIAAKNRTDIMERKRRNNSGGFRKASDFL